MLAGHNEEQQHQEGNAQCIEGDHERWPAAEAAGDRDEDGKRRDRIEDDEQGDEFVEKVVWKNRSQRSTPSLSIGRPTPVTIRTSYQRLRPWGQYMVEPARPARIWYQSFVHPTEQAPYITRLQGLLDA